MKPTRINCQTGSTARVKEGCEARYMADNGGITLEPGMEVEVTAAPRTLNGGGSVISLTMIQNGAAVEGCIFWSEFIKNFEMLVVADGDDLPEPKENKLARKIQKMADAGYYVESYINNEGLEVPAGRVKVVICIGPDATAKYARPDYGEWITLMWSIAPSRKFMATTNNEGRPQNGKYNHEKRYQYFPTWQALVASNLEIAECSRLAKSPNDTFSP